MSTDAAIILPKSLRDRWRDLQYESKYQELVREFQDLDFHTVFVRNHDGSEVPAQIRDGRYSSFAASPDEEEAKKSLEELSSTIAGELFVKPVPLALLARSAYKANISLRWLGHYNIGPIPLRWLGISAVVLDRNGEEVAYEYFVYEFEDGAAQKAPPYGSFQQWCTTEPDIGDDLYDGGEWFTVYDDQLEWDTNPRMPDVPADAIPVSSLSESEQAFFRRAQRRLLTPTSSARTPETKTASTSPDNPLVPEKLLGDFNRWRHQVSESLIPETKACKLLINRFPSGHDDSPANQAPSGFWFVTVDFPDRDGYLVSEGISIAPSELKESSQLPSNTGRHRMPPALREYLVSHIAWAMFHQARSIWPAFDLEPDALRALFPATPLNAYEVFSPDYKDTRFPCLARIKCQTRELAVLLLGQVGGNYVCQTLYHTPIPGDLLPAGLKRKDKLLTDGQLVFEETNSTILAPITLIDFPEHWYTGARSTVKFHVDAVASSMEFNYYRRHGKFPEEIEREPDPESPSIPLVMVKTTITILAVVIFFALLLPF